MKQMNLSSKQDRDTLKEQFFAAVGNAFARGASVARLQEISTKKGVWQDVWEQLAEEGVASRIKSWMRHTKDGQGRRVYHSLPSYDAEGNEIPIYKPVALFSLEDYKIVLAQHEKRAGEDIAVYLDLVAQAEERYGYHHPLPFEIRAYVNAVAEETTRTKKPQEKEKQSKVRPGS